MHMSKSQRYQILHDTHYRYAAPVSLAQVAATELVIPPRPHSIRMLLDSTLAEAGLKARLALEIESVPTILDLVQHEGFHAVLTLNAIRRSGNEARFQVRPIGRPRLSASSIAIACSAMTGPLMLPRAWVLESSQSSE